MPDGCLERSTGWLPSKPPCSAILLFVPHSKYPKIFPKNIGFFSKNPKPKNPDRISPKSSQIQHVKQKKFRVFKGVNQQIWKGMKGIPKTETDENLHKSYQIQHLFQRKKQKLGDLKG